MTDGSMCPRWALGRYGHLSGDWSPAKRHWPAVLRGVQALRVARDSTLTRPDALNAGLLPAGFNDGGIADEDFILKPVNVERLLDWIGRKLQIDWIRSALRCPSSGPRARCRGSISESFGVIRPATR